MNKMRIMGVFVICLSNCPPPFNRKEAQAASAGFRSQYQDTMIDPIFGSPYQDTMSKTFNERKKETPQQYRARKEREREERERKAEEREERERERKKERERKAEERKEREREKEIERERKERERERKAEERERKYKARLEEYTLFNMIAEWEDPQEYRARKDRQYMEYVEREKEIERERSNARKETPQEYRARKEREEQERKEREEKRARKEERARRIRSEILEWENSDECIEMQRKVKESFEKDLVRSRKIARERQANERQEQEKEASLRRQGYELVNRTYRYDPDATNPVVTIEPGVKWVECTKKEWVKRN